MARPLADAGTPSALNAAPNRFAMEITHEIVTVVEDGEGNVAAELAVSYALKRGGSVTLPGSLFAVVRDGRFIEQHMYVDFAPVFRAARKGA